MVKFSKAIFGNTDFLTAQSFIYTRTNFFNQPGNTVVLSCVISAIGEDIFNKVRQAGLDLEDKFFELDSTVPERIKDCLSFIKDSIADPESLQIQLVFWQENVLYIQSVGLQQAHILREGRLINLTSSDEQLVSGHIKLGDRLLLMSPRFEIEKTAVADVLMPEEEEKKAQVDDAIAQADENRGGSPKWDQRLIDDLINASIDNLDEVLTSHLNSPQTIEPVAVVLIDHQSDDDFKVVSPDSPQPEPEDTEQVVAMSNFGKRSDPLIPKILAFFNKFFSRIWRTSPRSRLIFIVSVLLLVGSLIAVVAWQSKQISQNKLQDTQIIQAQTYLTQAQSQKDTSPEEAKKSLEQAKTTVAAVLKKNPKNSKALSLQKQINDVSVDILKIYQITDFPLLLSLDLIKQGFHTTKMSYSLGQILLLDETQKTLVTVDLDKKTNQLLAGLPQLGDAKFASLNGQEAYSWSSDKGLVQINLEAKKPQVIVKPDSDWGNIADIYAFAGNVYLLDSLKNKVNKYVAIKSGLSDRLDYLKDGVQPDFNGAQRLQIDYSVWVLKSTPEIIRFTAGEKDNFSIGGLDQPIGSKITTIFPSENEDKLYLLDPDNSRLVVVKKSGEYLSQYVGEKFKTASDLVVDDEKKKLYLLDQDKIYSLDLR